jgi:predicted dehydrogenase
MGDSRFDRRDFLKGITTSTVLLGGLPRAADGARGHVRHETAAQPSPAAGATPRIRFAAIGLNHGHIYGQTDAVLQAGGELVWVYAKEPELLDAYTKRFPQARRARSEAEVLEDRSIQLVVSAAIPDERAPLGIRVMRHEKDYMADKPAMTTLEQLAEVRRVQAETRRIFSVAYSERFENRATTRAAELARAGAIGRVLQTIGTGPHRMNAKNRPAWFFDRARYGGIITDIGSHQADQFLYFTNSTRAEVVASQVGNVHHAQYPGLDDFGDAMLRGDGGTGYFRVDWFTPDGLATWGDTRLTVLGTDGYIEVRKNIDIAGRPGGNHLFLVDRKETRYIDSSNVPLPYGQQLVSDIANRTETAMPQAHAFLAMELVLTAQQRAQRLGT